MQQESIKKLFREWAEKKLETERAIGQILQHLIAQEREIERLKKALPPKPRREE